MHKIEEIHFQFFIANSLNKWQQALAMYFSYLEDLFYESVNWLMLNLLILSVASMMGLSWEWPHLMSRLPGTCREYVVLILRAIGKQDVLDYLEHLRLSFRPGKTHQKKLNKKKL